MSFSDAIKEHYCPFYNGCCKRTDCPAFQLHRPMTKDELQRWAAADVPVTDPYIHNWCIKYNNQVINTIVMAPGRY